MALEGVAGWLIDVEGTLVGDKAYRPLPGAVDWIASLRRGGTPFRILTNSTTHTPAGLAARLREAGFDAREEEVISGQERLVEILRGVGSPECWLLGHPALRETLEAAGLAVRDLTAELPGGDKTPRALILGWLDNPDARLFGRALELLQRPGVLFITMHRNRLFRNAGRLEPGLGAWAAALEYASGATALMAGKPSPEIFEAGARALDLPPARIAMVGDDPAADLAPAAHLGLKTVFVLSGKYADAGILEGLNLDFTPDLVIGGVEELVDG